MAEEFHSFNLLVQCMKESICKEVIVVAGNHDVRRFRDDWKLMRSMLTNVDHFVSSDSDTINVLGLSIFGCPWWYGHTWDYQIKSPEVDEDYATIAAGFNKIPKNLDILITHGPPMSILDLADATDTYPGTISGSKPLLDCVEAAQPRIHLFGHIHEQHGAISRGPTIFVNSAMKNRWPTSRSFLEHGPHIITASRRDETSDWSFEVSAGSPPAAQAE